MMAARRIGLMTACWARPKSTRRNTYATPVLPAWLALRVLSVPRAWWARPVTMVTTAMQAPRAPWVRQVPMAQRARPALAHASAEASRQGPAPRWSSRATARGTEQQRGRRAVAAGRVLRSAAECHRDIEALAVARAERGREPRDRVGREPESPSSDSSGAGGSLRHMTSVPRSAQRATGATLPPLSARHRPPASSTARFRPPRA